MVKLPDPKDPEAIWKALRAGLGIAISRKVVAGLSADGSLERYRKQPSQETYESLRQRASQYAGGAGRKPGKKTTLVPDQIFLPDEPLRARTYSRHLARLASRREYLVSLRQRLFRGRTLGVKRAESLLRQVAPRYFPYEWLEQNGIPLLRHESYLIDPKVGRDFRQWTANTVIRCEWNGGTKDIANATDIDSDARRSGVKLLLPRGEMSVERSSVFGEIQDVAGRLAEHYDWDESHATVFVLTGKVPYVPPISVREVGGWRDDHTHFAFELRVEPWVSSKSVLRAFQWLQRDAYGRQASPLRMRALVLFDFVEGYREKEIGKSWQEMEEEGLDFPWTKAAQLWNVEHGKELWDYTASSMSRDFERVWYAMVHPPLKPLAARRRQGRDKKS